jgi:hypothetical protein
MKRFPPVRRSLVALTILGALFALTLRADTVELKTGERLDGIFRQAGAAGVVIETAGQAITIPLDKIQAIYFGAAVRVRTDAGPTPFQDALDALKALRSVTESGVTYRDYTPRVLDTKVKVDRYLNSAGDTEGQQVAAIRLAMRAYELASRTWTANIKDLESMRSLVNGLNEPEILKCDSVRSFMRDKHRVWLNPASAASPLWTCGGAKVAEAERLLAQH